MNIKIGIIWVLIIATAVGTGTVVYNNFKVDDAHNLVGALGANVISSFGSGSSSSGGEFGYNGYNKFCTPESNNVFPFDSNNYFDDVDVYTVIKKVDDKIEGIIKRLKELDPSPTSFLPSKETLLRRQLEEIRKLVPGAVMGTYNTLLCTCLHPGYFNQQAIDMLSNLDRISMDQYSEMGAAEAMAARTILDTMVMSKLKDAADSEVKTCDRSSEQLIIPTEPMPGTPSVDYFPTRNIVPIQNQSKLQIINTSQTSNTPNQSGSVKLLNPITTPKPLAPINTIKQTAPSVGPVQNPVSPAATLPALAPQKLSSAQVCGIIGWSTANTCKTYTAYASRQTNPTYSYKGIIYNLSYTLHKNAAGAVCRDLCVATAK